MTFLTKYRIERVKAPTNFMGFDVRCYDLWDLDYHYYGAYEERYDDGNVIDYE